VFAASRRVDGDISNEISNGVQMAFKWPTLNNPIGHHPSADLSKEPKTEIQYR